MIEFFRINSKSLSKNPSSISHSQSKVQSTDRTMDGTMVVDIIAIKNIVNVEWKYLSREDMAKLKAELDTGNFVTIDYIDTTSSMEEKTIIALPGNLSFAPYYDYSTDQVIWKDVKINFTEK